MFYLLMKEAYYFDPATAQTNTAINLPSERTLAGRSNTWPLSVGGYRYTGLAPIICSKPVIFEQSYGCLTWAFAYRSEVNHGMPCVASAPWLQEHCLTQLFGSTTTQLLSAQHLWGWHK